MRLLISDALAPVSTKDLYLFLPILIIQELLAFDVSKLILSSKFLLTNRYQG